MLLGAGYRSCDLWTGTFCCICFANFPAHPPQDLFLYNNGIMYKPWTTFLMSGLYRNASCISFDSVIKVTWQQLSWHGYQWCVRKALLMLGLIHLSLFSGISVFIYAVHVDQYLLSVNKFASQSLLLVCVHTSFCWVKKNLVCRELGKKFLDPTLLN